MHEPVDAVLGEVGVPLVEERLVTLCGVLGQLGPVVLLREVLGEVANGLERLLPEDLDELLALLIP